MIRSCNIRWVIIKLIFLTFILSAVLSATAYAYLDPGTGSYVFQLFIAGVVGGLFAIKLFWKRIIEALRRVFIKK